MAKKIYDWIIFVISIIFLAVAFWGNIKGFCIKSILTTDGLTLFMIIITFVGTFSSNTKLYAPIVNKIKVLLLKRLDYDLYIVFNVNNSDNFNIEKYRKIIENKIIDNSGTSKRKVDLIYSRKYSAKSYIKNTHSNLTISLDDVNNEFSVKLDGGVSSGELNNIIGAIKNLFIDNALVSVGKMKRIKLTINLERSKLKLTDRFIINDKYNIKDLLYKYEIHRDIEVSISKDDIAMESITTSGFDKAYKNLLNLVSEFTVRGEF